MTEHTENQIRQLQDKVIAFRDARDWKQFHNPKDLAISLVLEATEVLEHFQYKNSEEVIDHTKKHKADIAEELSDVMYHLLLFAHDLEIDLVQAFEDKLAKNALKYPVATTRNTPSLPNDRILVH
jgi:dCTP diphosphatase